MFSCSLSASVVALSSFWFQKGLNIASGRAIAKKINRFQPILNVMNNLQPLPIELVNDTINNGTPRYLYSMVDIFTVTTLLYASTRV